MTIGGETRREAVYREQRGDRRDGWIYLHTHTHNRAYQSILSVTRKGIALQLNVKKLISNSADIINVQIALLMESELGQSWMRTVRERQWVALSTTRSSPVWCEAACRCTRPCAAVAWRRSRPRWSSAWRWARNTSAVPGPCTGTVSLSRSVKSETNRQRCIYQLAWSTALAYVAEFAEYLAQVPGAHFFRQVRYPQVAEFLWRCQALSTSIEDGRWYLVDGAIPYMPMARPRYPNGQHPIVLKALALNYIPWSRLPVVNIPQNTAPVCNGPNPLAINSSMHVIYDLFNLRIFPV